MVGHIQSLKKMVTIMVIKRPCTLPSTKYHFLGGKDILMDMHTHTKSS